MTDRMHFDALEDLGKQIHRLESSRQPGAARVRRWRSPSVLVLLLGVGVAGTASAAGVLEGIKVNSDGSVRPQDQAAISASLAPERRAQTAPHPAPAEVSTAFSAFADGKDHDADAPQSMRVWAQGTQRGGCIWHQKSTDLGPGGSCFTAAELLSGNAWTTSRGLLLVAVPDGATDVTVRTEDGVPRRYRVTSNILTASSGDRYTYRLNGVAVSGPQPGA